jgi:hypothetical protein
MLGGGTEGCRFCLRPCAKEVVAINAAAKVRIRDSFIRAGCGVMGETKREYGSFEQEETEGTEICDWRGSPELTPSHPLCPRRTMQTPSA